VQQWKIVMRTTLLPSFKNLSLFINVIF